MRTSTVTAALLACFALLIAGCDEQPPPYEEGMPEAPYTAPDEDGHDPTSPRRGDRPDDDVEEPPVEEPPAEEPPVEEPPVEEPPVEEPPVEEPPVEEPPVEEPPVEEPPVEEPPVEEPAHQPPPDDCPSVRVTNTGGVVLNVRPTPSTEESPVGTLAPSAVVTVLAVVPAGQSINGNSTWYEISSGSLAGYISGEYASCTDPSATPTFPNSTFLLPLKCGKTVKVTQGNNTSFSHKNASKYAFDFGIPVDTPLVAMKRGTVIFRRTATQPGDPCYSGGDSSCIAKANYVVIKHNDGTDTMYAHVNSVPVSVGQVVERGQTVARSGGTGWSTGPHAHVARQTHCGSSHCQSVAMSFGDVGGNGVPSSGQWVTSQNCP